MVKHNNLINDKIQIYAPWMDLIEKQILEKGGPDIAADTNTVSFVEKVAKAMKYSKIDRPVMAPPSGWCSSPVFPSEFSKITNEASIKESNPDQAYFRHMIYRIDNFNAQEYLTQERKV